MGEKNLDFDTVIDRSHTRSLKYDFAVQRGKPKGILPLWVADMDFKTSSYILEDLEKMNNHGIYGYSEPEASYFEVVKAWMAKRYEWEVQEEWLVKTPGIVYALVMAIRAYTQAGEAVMIQQPVYYPFSEVIQDNQRKLVVNTLQQDEKGHYSMDLEDFERQIITQHVKVFVLCSPHNPVGRVWTEEELLRVGEICLKHQVIVVSDEIHADFTFKGTHTVFTRVQKAYEDISIICTSPSKSFNIAGLQVANIWIASTKLREKFKQQMRASGYSQLNGAGLVACEAAYRDGAEWLDAVIQYIAANANYAKAFIEERMPKVKVVDLEGTYLMWLDFRAYGLSDEDLDWRMIYEAGVWLDKGGLFGEAGKGFQRINLACPRSILTEALKKIADAFQ
ncbi:MAG: MalY/PatB family protein [Cellulosilyticaceae bacterium]